jgi:hypothetical protein
MPEPPIDTAVIREMLEFGERPDYKMVRSMCDELDRARSDVIYFRSRNQETADKYVALITESEMLRGDVANLTAERFALLLVAEPAANLLAMHDEGRGWGPTNGESLRRALADPTVKGLLDDPPSFPCHPPDVPPWTRQRVADPPALDPASQAIADDLTGQGYGLPGEP